MFSWRDVQSKYGRIIALQKLPAGSMSAGGPKSSKLAKWMNEENGQIYEISRKKWASKFGLELSTTVKSRFKKDINFKIQLHI